MKKATIDVQAVINTMDKAINELKVGLPKAKLSKKAKQEIKNELEEVIALAKQLKEEID